MNPVDTHTSVEAAEAAAGHNYGRRISESHSYVLVSKARITWGVTRLVAWAAETETLVPANTWPVVHT